MNKKGIDTGDFLKIILAVLVLAVLLIPLAGKLLGVAKDSIEMKQAEASLENLVYEINQVAEGKREEALLTIESPKDWWILAWPFGENGDLPASCRGAYCVCICENVLVMSQQNYLESCEKNGVCSDVSLGVKTVEGILGLEHNQPFAIDSTSVMILKENDEVLIKKV